MYKDYHAFKVWFLKKGYSERPSDWSMALPIFAAAPSIEVALKTFDNNHKILRIAYKDQAVKAAAPLLAKAQAEALRRQAQSEHDKQKARDAKRAFNSSLAGIALCEKKIADKKERNLNKLAKKEAKYKKRAALLEEKRALFYWLQPMAAQASNITPSNQNSSDRMDPMALAPEDPAPRPDEPLQEESADSPSRPLTLTSVYCISKTPVRSGVSTKFI